MQMENKRENAYTRGVKDARTTTMPVEIFRMFNTSTFGPLWHAHQTFASIRKFTVAAEIRLRNGPTLRRIRKESRAILRDYRIGNHEKIAKGVDEMIYNGLREIKIYLES